MKSTMQTVQGYAKTANLATSTSTLRQYVMANPSVTAGWLLRAAVLLHALGVFLIVFSSLQTSFGNLVFLEWGFSHAQAVQIERVTVSMYLGLAIWAFIRPHWLVLVPVAGYVFLEAHTAFAMGGSRYSDLALGAQALRYLAPMALLLLVAPLLRNQPKRTHLSVVNWLLRIAVAVVFSVHGWEALQGYSRFIDLIIGTASNILDVRIAEQDAVLILQGIALVDFAVAGAVLVRPRWPVLLWLAFWGLVTALSRVTNLGLGAYTEVLVRAAHMLCPLALGFLLLALQRQPYPADTNGRGTMPGG